MESRGYGGVLVRARPPKRVGGNGGCFTGRSRQALKALQGYPITGAPRLKTGEK